MSIRVGIVGLGKMGLPLAARLIDKGFPVTGHRRHSMHDLASLGGTPAASNREVAERSDIVISCLPNDQALHEAVMGENGLVEGAHPGLIVVEISMLTLRAKEQARQALEQVGVTMLDCPISGTPPMIAPGKTVFFGSGDRETFDQALPVFEAITSNTFYLGPFGAGSKMKCVANLLVAVHNLAAAEAMVLSTKAGLDPEMVMKVINPSIAGSAAFAARAPAMVARRYSPPLGSVSQVKEFILIIRELTESLGVPTPMLDVAEHYYEDAVASGHGEKDVAALYALLSSYAGME
ncbi:MAG TPA: NAD(P)-dependent oxidoreductase [Ktedonobacteraceae bacterium]|nr:NAD(P)-dependent oxidoreductase [Ktedonobacteraceae bacterium]